VQAVQETLPIIYCGKGLSIRTLHWALSSGEGVKEARSEMFPITLISTSETQVPRYFFLRFAITFFRRLNVLPRFSGWVFSRPNSTDQTLSPSTWVADKDGRVQVLFPLKASQSQGALLVNKYGVFDRFGLL
jgi:hypothetical protein